jgi:hypothetical protein
LLGAVDPALAGAIEQIASRAMSADRDRRYQSAADLATDLRACLEGRAPTLSHSVDRGAIADAPRVLTAESVDRRWVAVGLTNGTVTVLDATSGTQLSAIEGDGSRLERLAFDNEGRLSIAWSSGRSVLIGTVDLV